ncbi:hypothetical protein ES703_48536 [subsurface metagenome]
MAMLYSHTSLQKGSTQTNPFSSFHNCLVPAIFTAYFLDLYRARIGSLNTTILPMIWYPLSLSFLMYKFISFISVLCEPTRFTIFNFDLYVSFPCESFMSITSVFIKSPKLLRSLSIYFLSPAL